MPAITSETPMHAAIINATTSSLSPMPLERRLQAVAADAAPGNAGGDSLPPLPSIASIILSNFLPAYETEASTSASTLNASASAYTFPTFSPPSIESLVASSAEDLSNFRDVTFDIFDDDDDLFGSPLAFDASENGLWNGRFVPPPPRPPFFVDEPVLSDGLTTCDLCSWAMPTKSTFIFEGTIEKASELGWPLTLIIVSVLSALLGAIIMVTVVRCRRKKSSNNRNETHVQWWSRNKRPNGGSNNNNHLRRSNIYTAHPADSIRGLQQPSLSAASSLTTMTAMGAAGVIGGGGGVGGIGVGTAATTATAVMTPSTSAHSQQCHQYHTHHHHPHTSGGALHPHQQVMQHEYEYDEHEYHQPQELHLQLQHHHRHQRQHSSSISSANSSPSLAATSAAMIALPHQPQQHNEQQRQCEDICQWPNSTLIVAS